METKLQPTSLYRHFDADGALLYVGVSLSAVARLGKHQSHSYWFGRIVRVEVEQFESRAAALEAETKAIQSESPECNLAKVPKAASAFEKSELARKRLYSRTVNFKPLYTVPEAAKALGLSDTALRKKIAEGEVEAYELSRTVSNRSDGTERVAIKYAISGWHIIDYIEHLEKTKKP